MHREQALRLFWKDRLIGEVTDVGWVDFLWAGGKLVIKKLSQKLRKALEYVFAESQSEDGLQEWPFPDELFWNWSVVKPDNTKVEIGIPIIDFTDGSIEWR
jgi:hypothetical protein